MGTQATGTQAKIAATDEAWDKGELGESEAHVKKLDDDIEAQIDEALGLQPISIRLQKSLIEDFKMVATLNGIGYQPLMRQVLKRFVESEKKRILMEKAAEVMAAQAAAKKNGKNAGGDEHHSPQRKQA